jgi:iron complex outermembrane receptor protein
MGESQAKAARSAGEMRAAKLLLASAVAAALPGIAAAQQGSGEPIAEVVTTGTRVEGRAAIDASVPVDVLQSADLEAQGSFDMDDLLRNSLPSYNVQRLPISDAASITRPATLRGLPPDNVLILVNGKRRHRASVIAELGGSLAAGSQGPDISIIPTIALQSVEVLRDGAAAQYGSDAIAGVINFKLREDSEGITTTGRYGDTFEGDGTAYQLAANVGMPLGPNGFANVSFQYRQQDPSVRSLQRTDAQALIDTGNTDVREPFAQIWGQPEVSDDFVAFVNLGIDTSDTQQVYGFANYAQRRSEGGFFFRNPNNRGGVFTQDGIRAIMDLDLAGQSGQTSNCPVLTSPGGTPSDQAAVDADRAALAALPDNCFVFNSGIPGGFTPTFGGEVKDIAGAFGVRGEFDNGLGYDFSVNLGQNETEFFLNNTLNPSLGPDSPRDFSIGSYRQRESNFNADFVYPFEIAALASPLNVAFGAEYRIETFEVTLGQEESWVAGDFAFQGSNFHSDGVTPLASMSIGANGFAGFGPSQVGTFDRANYAFYVDTEADVTDRLTLGAAVRFEDFDSFGTTTNGKLSGRFAFTDRFAMRASASTGFRAPTPGQANVTKVSTITVDGVLQQRGQIPPTNPIAQFLGAEPLKPEKAVNYTVGLVWEATDNLLFTLDFFRIELEDRISQTGTINIAGEPVPPDIAGDCPTATNLAECLQELGVPGAADLSSVSFFTNDFDTTTQGIDFVGTYTREWGGGGLSTLTAAWNYTDTKVDAAGTEVSRNRILDLENFNPRNRGIFSLQHVQNNWTFLARASFYDEWTEGSNNGDPTFTPGTPSYTIDCTLGVDNCYGAEWVFDLEAGYTFRDRYSIFVGAQNIANNFGPEDKDNLVPVDNPTIGAGNAYETGTPFGFNGGFWYARFQADF